MKQKLDPPADQSSEAADGPQAVTSTMLRSEDLLQGRSEVWIKHGDETYRLRLTSAGKLYLTK